MKVLLLGTVTKTSQVLYTKHERNKTKPSFEAEAFLNDTFTININYKPVRNSLYSLHMSQWLKYFSLKNFLILDGDKFIVDPLPQASNFNALLFILKLIMCFFPFASLKSFLEKI